MMDDFLDALCNALSKYQPPRLLDLLWIWTVSAIMGNWTPLVVLCSSILLTVVCAWYLLMRFPAVRTFAF